VNDDRRVVITDIGPITPIRIGMQRLWDGLHSGRSPVGQVTRFDASPFRSTIGAAVHDFEPDDFMDRQLSRKLDLFAQFTVTATRAAVDDADLKTSSLDPGKVAVQMGSAFGGLVHGQREIMNCLQRSVRGVDARVATTAFCGAASCQVAIELGLTGPNSTNAMSCAPGTIAIGDAWRLIRSGEVDAAVCGGIEAPIGPLSYGAFAITRAMSTRNDNPERARTRGARIYAAVRGYGTTNDTHHMTVPLPDGAQAAVVGRWRQEGCDLRRWTT
jgi:3-oxoacyl-[acyl-carrier-protein] synthase II